MTNPENPAAASTSSPTVEAGQYVYYVPHLCYALDCDNKNELLFVFAFERSYKGKHASYQAGEAATNLGQLGKGRWRRTDNGGYVTGGGHRLKLVGPGQPWPAVVRAVFANATVALDIAHPDTGALQHGFAGFAGRPGKVIHTPHVGWTEKLLLSSTGTVLDPQNGKQITGLAYDGTGKTPHSWHLLADAKGGS